MSSNTNIGNTPVNQGYVQLVHMGETGGIDGTLRTLYDGDGTASDLQIASNKVKISTELFIGSKTITEYVQDVVGTMFTTGSYTNITTTYDDTNGNIDLSASGEVTLTGSETLTNKTLTSPVINTGVSGSAILDSDTMSGASATTLSSSESIKAYVDTEVAGIVSSAPSTLDTLNELAAALGNDENFSTTVTNSIATKASLTGTETLTNKTLASPTFTGDIDFTDASTPVLRVTDTTNTVTTIIQSANSAGKVGTSTNHNLNIVRNNVAQILLQEDFLIINNPGNDLDVNIKDSSANSLFRTDAANSRVGILDSTPSHTLDVNGTGRFTGTLTLDGDADIDGTLETDALTIGGVTSVPFEAADHSKLDGIEALADVTDTANVTSAGALMDSEVTDLDGIKSLTVPNDTTISDAAKTLLDDDSTTNMRTTLGLEIGTNVQAYDAGLQSISGLTTATNKMIYTTGSDTYAVTTLSATGRSLIDDNTTADMLTTLGLTATAAELNYTDGVTSNIQTQLGTKVPTTRSITPVSQRGISGGGDLSADRTFELSSSQLSQVTLDAADNLILFDNSDNDIPKRFIAQDIFDSLGGITIDGTTANGLLTYGGTNNIDTEANLTFDASNVLTATDGSESMAYTPSNNYFTIHEAGATKGSHLRLATDNSDFILTAGGGTNQLSIYDVNGTANRLVVNSSGTFHFQHHVTLQATKKLYLDGGSNTYIDEPSGDQLRLVAGGTEVLKGYSGGAIDMYGGSINRSINIGANRTADAASFIDLIGDTTYTDYGARLIRNSGANAITDLTHRGTGALRLRCQDAGAVLFMISDAEKMRVASSGNVGIGTASPGTKLEVKAAGDTSQEVIKIRNSSGTEVMTIAAIDSGGDGYINFNTSPGTINTNGGHLVLSPGGSGNVGIGTTSPGNKLEVRGDIAVAISDTQDIIKLSDAGNDGSIELYTGESTPVLRTKLTAYGDSYFGNSNAKLGIGTVSPLGKLHIESGTSTDTALMLKVQYNTSGGDRGKIQWRDGANITGSIHTEYDGTDVSMHFGSLYNAGYNTTTRMTLTGQGQLGIGTTSPDEKLSVVSGSSSRTAHFGRYEDNGLFLHSEAAANDSHYNWMIQTQENIDGGLEIHPSASVGGYDWVSAGGLAIKRTGEVGIGTNSPGYKLDVAGDARSDRLIFRTNASAPTADAAIFRPADNSFGISTGNTERMRINSSGNVLIGGTSASGHGFNLEVLNDHAYVKGPDGWNGNGDKAIVALGSAASNESFGCGYVYGTGLVLSTYKLSGGGDFGSSTQNSLEIADTTGVASFINDVVAFATSDKRLKENVKPLDNALDKINKINGVEFDWIDGKDEHGNSVHGNEGHDVGVIAQEIEEILPEVVTTRDNGYKAVKYEKIVPLLIEAIKELKTEIEELKNG